jgi:glutamine synthetase
MRTWLCVRFSTPDGTPHPSNGRATIDDDDNDFWFGFEQEYFLWDVDTQLPPGFPPGGFPAPQGPLLLLRRCRQRTRA